ncbi:LysE family translocator [Nisaea sediminum]|uniref:LysE family translocator n=1 Tax=Nisaea sediminum TaxID=2775867 RepID=UPI0018681A46|nr:LysE family translocator [Nisaea sediminum]
MSDLSVFIKALGIGVAVAAPVGPMSILLMRTTLARGWRNGLAIGGGIAIADGMFGMIAALGLAGISSFMLEYEKPLHVAAGLFLIYLGLRKLFSRGDEDMAARPVSRAGWARDLATAWLLTMTNPPTIIMFAAVFTAIAPAGGLDAAVALVTVAGVFLGSMLWWCFLVSVVSGVRHAIGHKARTWIERLSGIVLAALGINEIRRGFAG